MVKIEALHRLKAPLSKGRPLKKFAVYVTNGFNFELDSIIEAETLKDARKEWERINKGSHAGEPKNFKLRDVTGKPGWE